MTKRVTLDDYIDTYKEKIEEKLKTSLDGLDVPEKLKESILYSLLAGGKRLRPVLLIASFEAFSSQVEKAYSSALALEMVHTYSLIHDDLPAMDDDDYRRGKATNHRKFDEGLAILAGDALLTYAFEMIGKDHHLRADEKAYIMTALAKAAGPEGMVAGQVLDIEAETNLVPLEQLEIVHNKKTGKLVQFAVSIGAYLGNATKKQQAHLEKFAYYLGLIFQVQDDILDVTGDPDKIGKPVGSDRENEKSTYPNLLGLDGAIEQKDYYIELGKQELIDAGVEESFMMDLMYHFSERDH